MRPNEIRALLRPRPLELDGTRRRLARAHSVADLAALARRRVPRAVFDYVEGSADDELTLRRAREAFARLEFSPHVLRDVSSVQTATTVLGRPAALPVVLAPTGFTRMMHHDGERAVVRAAARTGLPYTLSTMGTVSVEDVAAAAPRAQRWFQLYVWRDRGLSKELVLRAREAGYHALVLTVDVPVSGNRLRDLHNGLTIPPTLSLRTLLDGARHPAWWYHLLATEALAFASVPSDDPMGVMAVISTLFDPSLAWDDVDWMAQLWDGPLVLKGIQTVADAQRAARMGVAGIVVSNHGGRQLDRAPVPIEVLPRVVDAVGSDTEVYLDTGVRTGSDVVAAVALGARAVLVGRAYLYGLMAGGERGVQRAVDILGAEVARTLQLLGVPSVAELTPDRVRLRP